MLLAEVGGQATARSIAEAAIGVDPIDDGAVSASRYLKALALPWGQLPYCQGMGR